METLETELLVGLLSEEQQAEVVRLQHGIAVLDLFSQELVLEDRSKTFLLKTQSGTETRADILRGPSYLGDEAKLNRAIAKAKNHYAILNMRRHAMYEHALFLGVNAELQKGQVFVADADERRRLSLAHGNWRVNFSSHLSNEAREKYRAHLETRIDTIRGVTKLNMGEVGLSVNLEERAILLTRAVNAMARRSMLSGLGVGIADDQYNEEIYERYQEDTPHLDKASERKVDRLLKKAKRDFWQASGFPEIRLSGSMKEHLLERRAQKMWKEFAGQFEHSLQQRQRVKFRKQLHRFVPEERSDETKID